MSMQRSRFSGTASLFNRLNQLIFALKFWAVIAVLVAVLIFCSRLYPIIRVNNVSDFFVKASIYELTLYVRFPWVGILPEEYRSAVVGRTAQYLDLYLYILQQIKKSLFEGLGAGCLVMIAGYIWSRREARVQTEDRHLRGSQLTNPRKLTRMLRKNEGKGQIHLGEIILPNRAETRGVITIGMLGVGKTQLVNRILDTVVQRQERGIIFCAKGDDFVATHWSEGDAILCPADSRTVGWSLMADIADIADFDLIARSLVDDSNEKTKTWSGGAKLIISGLLKYCYLSGLRHNKNICEVFSLDATGMRDCLRKTPGAEQAAGLLAEPTSPPSISFFITVCLYSHPLHLLKHIDGDFSISRWVNKGSGRIYLPITPKLHRQLGPLYSVFIDLAIVHHLSLPNDTNRRIWYFLDELSALGVIPGLSQLVNIGRSKGAAVIAGTQSYPQLDLLYGHDQRRAILNGFATRAIFRNEDELTLAELSKTLGCHEIERTRENLATAHHKDRDGVTKLAETVEEALVKPDEIKNLSSLNFYVHSSGYPATKTCISYREWHQVIPSHISHPELSLAALSAEYLALQQKLDDMKLVSAADNGSSLLM